MIPNIDQLLRTSIAQAFQACFAHSVAPADVMLQTTRKDFAGDRTLVTFAYTKALGKGPEQLGETLGAWLKEHDALVVGYNVVKGFLNLEIADSFWASVLAAYQTLPNPVQLPATGQKVMVEYSSPNTNKPLHLGHLRNIFLGYSISQILKAAGHEVVMTNLINDRGIHICKSMLAYQRFGNGETPASAGIKGDHLVGKYYVAFDEAYRAEVKALEEAGAKEADAKANAPLMKAAQEMLRQWEEGNEEVIALWQTMNGWVYDGFEDTYRTIGVSFDHKYYESNTYLLGKDIVEEGVAKGVFYKKEDGSVWCDLTEEGLDQKLVLRSDGTSVYITQDMGTADLKYNDFGTERSIYVVGNEQDYHFKVLFHIMRKLGRPYAQGLYHMSYGMVSLPSGKMKSREGTVVDADDLLAELVSIAESRTRELGKIDDFDSEEARQLNHIMGVGAIKYYLLKVEPVKGMMFNPQESVDFQGNTATFIQYTHARIRSIERKAAEMGVSTTDITTVAPAAMHTAERNLALVLAEVQDRVQEAADGYSPATLANYFYEVAKTYNSFFAECPVLKAEDAHTIAFRVQLSSLTGSVLRHVGALLGIQMPERM